MTPWPPSMFCAQHVQNVSMSVCGEKGKAWGRNSCGQPGYYSCYFKTTMNTVVGGVGFHSFSWSLNNPSVRLAYLRGTFNNSFMPEHPCLFWDNIQGHEEHEIHIPALYKAAAAERLGLRWRIHEEARRPKLDWYENKNISVTSNSADCKARVLAASVPHSCTNTTDVFYLMTPVFWHCGWLHVHSN